VIEAGADRGAARTAALGRAKHALVLALEPGETLDPASWPELAAFAASGAALGVVSVLVPAADGTIRRERRVRLARRDGARAEGASVDRFVHASGATAAETAVRLLAPPPDDARDLRLREALRAERAAKADDAWVAARLAESLVASDPVAAVELAGEALDALPLEGPDVQAVVLTLASALHAGGGRDELLGLAAACRERFPGWPDLRLFEALAFGAMQRDREMIASLEACLAIGESETSPGTLGAGSTLPLFHLGAVAERSGDARAARALYLRALPLPPARAALERLAEDASARARAFASPPRLVDNGVVAMKACRHGTFAYPVNDAFVGRALDLYGEWCEGELDVLGPRIGEGDVVLDIGANIGSHTLFFARAVGATGKVIAFEPQRFVHGLLAANVATNGFTNVECRREAVGGSSGEVAIPVLDPRAKANFGAVATRASGAPDATDERVPLVTVDALDLARCDLIKIDVEGLEAAVLDGARNTIAKHRPTLFVENDTVPRSAEILRAIRALGYRAYWQIAPYFDPANHFGNPEDVFAVYQPQANLVCVPADRPLEGLLEAIGEDDDFVKALARTGGAPTPVRAARAPAALPSAPAALAPAAKAARPLTVVCCIPGREFSGRFFDAWNAFAERCRDVGVRLVLSRTYDAVVYYARNKVAGGDVRRGPKQAPWGGTIDYDYMLWIDSDVVFRFEDFQRLLAHKVDIASGLYLMADATHFAAVEHMDEARFQRDGRFEFLTPAKVAARSGLVPVDYCGFGFVLVRRGVFERLEYPWFRPIYVEMGECREFTSEDVGFCMLAKKAGIPILVDPKVVVGHEKAVVLLPPLLQGVSAGQAGRAA
jgi:FkbM family methyltransferase